MSCQRFKRLFVERCQRRCTMQLVHTELGTVSIERVTTQQYFHFGMQQWIPAAYKI